MEQISLLCLLLLGPCGSSDDRTGQAQHSAHRAQLVAKEAIAREAIVSESAKDKKLSKKSKPMDLEHKKIAQFD